MIEALEHSTGAAETSQPDLFEPGDPRAGPFTPDQIDEARRHATEPGRWHKLSPSVDWFAVQLQYGRGLTLSEVASLFGIGERPIYRRRDRDRWPARLTDRDRRSLARLVWLAGKARLAPNDDDGRKLLASISEWRLFERPEFPRWQPQDPDGEIRPFRLGAGV